MRTASRSRRPSPPRKAPLTVTLGALLLGGHAAASCDAPELLLSVRLGQSDRGSQIVRLDVQGGQVRDALLPADLLRADEQGYVAERVDCDGVALVRLKPDLTITYRESQQDLLIRPRPTYLGQRSIDVSRALTTNAPAAQPALGVDFGVNTQVNYEQGNPERGLGSTQAYLGIGIAAPRATGYAGAVASLNPNQTDPAAARRVDLRANAQYTVTPELTLLGDVHTEPGRAQPVPDTRVAASVTATYQRFTPRLYPDITLSLESPTDITVIVNGQTLGTLSVGAGEVHLTNIPLQPTRNVIQLWLDSETGVTQQTIAVPDDRVVTPGQDLGIRATIGLDDGQWNGQLSAQTTLSTTLAAQGNVQVEAGGALAAGLQASMVSDTMPEGQSLSGTVGMQLKRSAPTATLAAQVTTTANASVLYTRDRLNVNLRATVPFQNLSGSTVSVGASLNEEPWTLSGSVGTAFTPRSWTASLSAARKINERSALSLSGSVAPSGYSVRLQGSYVFTPQLRGEANGTLTNGAARPSASLTFKPTPDQTVGLNVSPGNVSANYNLTRDVTLNVTANLTDATADLSGALSVMNGKLTVSRALIQRGVLIRTGVPGLILIVNGVPSSPANRDGDVLITSAPPGENLTVRVNTRELPLGIAVGSSALEIRAAPLGLTTVDWRANFTVSTFVRFFWAPGQPAENADLLLNGELIPLDDEGYGLIERSTQPRTGELRDSQTGRRCAAPLPPGADTVTCAP